MTSAPTIFIDLDGTLIRTDVFAESAIRLVKAKPTAILSLIAWSLRGRSVAKTMVARLAPFDASMLPYNEEVIALLTREREGGRQIVLTTAAHWKPARAVARHLGIFDDVLASDARRNLKGTAKLARIRAFAQDRAFTYGGDNRSDRPIWRAAQSAIFVNAPRKDIAEASGRGATEAKFSVGTGSLRELLRAVRPHQWAKNALVAVPLFTSHSYASPAALAATAIAFVCFCLCASGVYLLNDMLDIDADRRHGNLSSAVRLFVLDHFRAAAAGERQRNDASVGAQDFRQ